MRRSLVRASAPPALALVLACTFVLGCGLIERKRATATDDDDEPPATAPTVAVTGTGAKNEKDILRYASETKLANEPGIIGKDATKVKTFPASGADVTALVKGTSVVKIAKFFRTGVLVTFVDPSASDGSKLMGWIAPEALAAPVPLTPTPPSPTNPAKVFVAVDAGPKPIVDAGGGVDPGKAVVVDAGRPVPVQSSGTITALPIGGKCPAGMILVNPLCRRPCAADSDCPTGAFCTSSGGRKTCSATR